MEQNRKKQLTENYQGEVTLVLSNVDKDILTVDNNGIGYITKQTFDKKHSKPIVIKTDGTDVSNQCVGFNPSSFWAVGNSSYATEEEGSGEEIKVQFLSFELVPKDKKGEKQYYRLATPPSLLYGSVDYYNRLNRDSSCYASKNKINPVAKKGIAYTGINLTAIQGDKKIRGREYLQTELNKKMEAGKEYYFEMLIKFSDASMYSSNTLGVHFSRLPIYTKDIKSEKVLKGEPQIHTKGKVLNDYGWTLFKGTIKAGGGEKYLTIGDFNSKEFKPKFNYIKNGTERMSYYFIDNVRLVLLEDEQLDSK